MTPKPAFGFEALAEIRPVGQAPAPIPAAVDAAGERLGFQSREAPPRRLKRQVSTEPTDQINIRANVADLNKFVLFCERNRLSYREAFAELVKRIEG